MKKVVLAVVALLVVGGLGAVIFFVVRSYDNNTYNRRLLIHPASITAEAPAVAEYDGMRVAISPRNITRIMDDVGRKSRDNVYLRPDYVTETAVKITFPDGAEYIVGQDPEDEQRCYILYSYDGSSLYYSTYKLSTLDWVRKAVSPDGLYEPNTILED
ncbi:MAG: hypothetical protein ACI4V3_10715 [Faecousia sp.]